LGIFSKKLLTKTIMMGGISVLVAILMTSSLTLVYAFDTPIISIGLDHGFNSQKDVVDYMGEKNMRGSVFYVTQNFNNSFFMDSTTLLDLQDQNWEIVSHTNNHTRLVNVPQSIIDYEVIESKIIFEEMGFQIYGFTPPFIALPEPALTTVEENYNWYGYAGGPVSQPEYDVSSATYRVPTSEVGSGSQIHDFQSAKTIIDNAIANNQWLVLNVHQIDNNSDNPFSFPLAEFQQIIDYIDDTNVPVLPISEVLGLSNKNNPPTADDDSPFTDEDTALPITLSATDADGDSLTYSVVAGPTNGVLSGTAPNLTYTPNSNYYGDDSFTFTANDGTDDSNTAAVSITINPINDPPTSDAGGPYSGTPGTAILFSGSASDVDGDSLTYSWDFGDETLGNGQNPSHTYSIEGPFTVTLVVSDGILDSSPSETSVEISEANEAPTADAGGPYSGVVKGDLVTLDGTGSSDPNGDPLTFEWIKISGPKIILSDSTSESPTFTAPKVGKNGKTVEFQLIVSDGEFTNSENVRIFIAYS
jgi:hypothetical protein